MEKVKVIEPSGKQYEPVYQEWKDLLSRQLEVER
jgi:hypothetical protein